MQMDKIVIPHEAYWMVIQAHNQPKSSIQWINLHILT